MSQIAFCIVLLLMVHPVIMATVELVSIPGNGEAVTCPLREKNEAIQRIKTSVLETILNFTIFTCTDCGSGLWYRIAHLNMSNSSQQCPSAWREYCLESGDAGDQRPHLVAVQLLSTLPIASTAKSVGELLAINMELQMVLVIKHMVMELIHTMSMELA